MSDQEPSAAPAAALPSDLAASAGGPRHAGGANLSAKGSKSALEAASKGDEGAPKPAGADEVLRSIVCGTQEPPVFLWLGKREVAVVDAAVYRELLKTAGRASFGGVNVKGVLPRRKPRPVSTIERDEEVAEFLRSRFRGGVTVTEIRDACLRAFGGERTPSHTRIQRFRKAPRQSRRDRERPPRTRGPGKSQTIPPRISDFRQ